MIDTHNDYEIAFDVPGRRREEFEDWLSSEVVDWVNHERVAYFEVFQNYESLSPELKFVFGFESLLDWATFVNSDEHEAAIVALGTLTEDRDAVLWQRASVKLDEAPEDPIEDGGRPDVSAWKRRGDPLISR